MTVSRKIENNNEELEMIIDKKEPNGNEEGEKYNN